MINIIEINRIRNDTAITAARIKMIIIESCTVEQIAANPHLDEAMK